MAGAVSVDKAGNSQGRPLAGLFGLRVFAQPDARQGVQRRLSGLLGRYSAVASEREPTLGDASATGAWSVFEDESLRPARRDS
jgi:hypothetical protein